MPIPPSDGESEAVWAAARAAGVISPELEHEHAELVALRRYARALELRWAVALESIIARSRLAEARRAAGVALTTLRTDLGNAERFVARRGRDLRYVPEWKRWLVWDGKRWAPDESLDVQWRAQDSIRSSNHVGRPA